MRALQIIGGLVVVTALGVGVAGIAHLFVEGVRPRQQTKRRKK